MTEQFQSPRNLLPNIHLVYGTPNFPQPNLEEIGKAIRNVENNFGDKAVAVTWDFQEPQKCLGQVEIGPHIIRVAGLSTPLPQ